MSGLNVRSLMPRIRVLVEGLSCGVRAQLAKEVRAGSRGWRFTMMLTGYLFALALFVAGFLALADNTVLGTAPALGLQLFSLLASVAVLMLAFITVAVTTGSISGERERRTLDLLLVTRASALGLVAGKLAGSLIHVLFLLVASLPAFALVYLFGGVPAQYFVLFFIVASATAVSHAAIGVLLSAWLRRTMLATVLAFVIVLFTFAGVPIAAGIAGANQTMEAMASSSMSYSSSSSMGWQPYAPFVVVAMQRAGPPRTFAYASPLVALASILPAGGPPGDDAGMAGPAMQLFVVGTLRGGESGISLWRAAYVRRIDPVTGMPEIVITWAPWLYYVGFSLATVPIALLLAAAALSPARGRGLIRSVRRRRQLEPAT